MNIIITGASRGIGYATVTALSKKIKGKVVSVARSEKRLCKLQKEANRPDFQVIPLPFDLSNKDLNKKLLPVILKKFNNSHLRNHSCLAKPFTIDILINNAAMIIKKTFAETTRKDIEKIFQVNLFSIMELTRLLLPYFSKKAHIVNISSLAGYQGCEKFPGLSLYSATKGALSTLTEVLAAELRDKGISVNALCPGGVDTEMFREVFPDYKATVTAHQMGNYIADFAIHGASQHNGKIIPVNL